MRVVNHSEPVPQDARRDPYREDGGVIRPTLAERGRTIVAAMRSWSRRLAALWTATRGVFSALGALGRSLTRFRQAMGQLRNRRRTGAK